MDQVVDVVTPIYPITTAYQQQQTTIAPPSWNTQNRFDSTTIHLSPTSNEHFEFMKQQIRNMEVTIKDELDKSPDLIYEQCDYEPSGILAEVKI